MKNIILLFFVLAFTSCATFKANSLAENRQTLSKENLKKFEGTYKVISKDTIDRFGYYSIDESYIKKKDSVENNLATLKLMDENHLKFEISNDTTILKSWIVKFKVRRNYLFFEKKTYYESIVIINSKVVFKTRVCLSESGNLILDNIYSSSVFLFIMPFNEVRQDHYGVEFERIK